MLENLFSNSKPIIGVVHVGALPGTPASKLSMVELITLAAHEAGLYRSGGVDAVIIENMHDVPYLRGRVGEEIVAGFALNG
jgi:predicted TIM-barrel enzyme